MMNFPYLFCITIYLLFQVIPQKVKAQIPEFAWAMRAGGTEPDAASRIDTDAEGNSYITGIFRGTARFGDIELTSSGMEDVFIAKYDASGQVLWAKQAGGPDIQSGKNIVADHSGNAYIIGDFIGSITFDTITLTSHGNYDVFVAKYAPEGHVVWARQSGGATLEAGRGIAVDDSGNCYITGYFDGSGVFDTTKLTGSGGYDVFVAKYDAAGNLLWAKRAGGAGEDFGRNVAVDGSGNSYVTGTFRNVAGFDTTTLISSGLEDIFITRYDASGHVVWAKKAGGTAKDAGIGIDTDPAGNSYITGEFRGNATFGSTMLTSDGSQPDIFIARYDASGNELWAKKAGGSASDFGKNIAVDGSGDSYITGEFEGSADFGGTTVTGSGGTDIFVAKYDASGNALWAKRAGGSLEDRAAGIATDSGGNIYISGYFLGEAGFGSTTITSSGVSDIYLAKLSPLTGVSPATGFQISTYPNPFAGSLTVSLPDADPATVSLTDLLGRQVYREEIFPEAGGITATLTPGDGLASGIYWLRVEQKKVVKGVMVVRR